MTQQQQQIRVNLDEQPQLQCECGCTQFYPLLKFVFISRIQAGSPQDLLQQHPALAIQCSNPDCNKVYESPQALTEYTPGLFKPVL